MRRYDSRRLFLRVLGSIFLLIGSTAYADDLTLPGGVLRVCSDPNNMPFSNENGEGFENKIAELFAKKMGWKLETFYFPQRIGFVRNTLRFKLPGERFRCDLIMGIPASYDQASPTKPYFYSSYAIVMSNENLTAGVHSQAEFLALPKSVLQPMKIGVQVQSPGALWLMQNNLLDQAVPYPLLNADPQYYAGEIIERDLASGKIDAALMWGPIAGFFSKRVVEKSLTVIPLYSTVGNQLEFGIAMGVRHEDVAWKATIQYLIDENQADIVNILRQYHVPSRVPQKNQILTGFLSTGKDANELPSH